MAKKNTSPRPRRSASAAKTPAGSKLPRASAVKASAPDVPAVRVRMYRQGLGDCFLITFDCGGQNEQHMLIDFGSLGTKATSVKMSDVIADISKVTGQRLAILTATHAHQDHVSGFLSQQPALQAFNIENVWMPWTEDPGDALAKELGNKAAAMRATIAKALSMPEAKESGVAEKIAGMAAFEGLGLDSDALAQFGGELGMGDSIARALDIVRKFPGAKTTYHSPGPPAIEMPGIDGFRFYVLGPPRDADKLRNMENNAADELYGLASAIDAHAASGFDWTVDDEAPFDQRFCYPAAQTEQFYPDYGLSDQAYRRIDNQWFRSVAALAAKLDNFRNNTSLALAIERIADGKVLLFPADAQEGNWLSWHDPKMKWKAGSGDQLITAADLLERTVFYKVGHHSSHNATAKGEGLEIMRKNQALTAFIPVDRTIALKRSPPGSWRMPAVELYKALLQACDGRVARADLGWAAEATGVTKTDVEGAYIDLASTADWTHWSASQMAATNVTTYDLFIEYLLQ
jgi:hypothetical protein